MARAAVAIELRASERAESEGLAGRRRTAQGLAKRAPIVLAAADGTESKIIAGLVGRTRTRSVNWRRRLAERRLAGLYRNRQNF